MASVPIITQSSSETEALYLPSHTVIAYCVYITSYNLHVCTLSFTMYSFLRQFDFTRAYVFLRSHSALLARAESQEVRFSSSSTGQQSSRQCNLNQVHTPGKLNVLQPQYTWLLALLLPLTRHSIHSFHPYFTEKRNQNILSVDLVLSVANRAWSPLQYTPCHMMSVLSVVPCWAHCRATYPQ